MVNFKDWTLRNFGDVLLLGLLTIITVTIFHMIVSPLLVTILPAVFTAKLTITDTLLFLLLTVYLGKK